MVVPNGEPRIFRRVTYRCLRPRLFAKRSKRQRLVVLDLVALRLSRPGTFPNAHPRPSDDPIFGSLPIDTCCQGVERSIDYDRPAWQRLYREEMGYRSPPNRPYRCQPTPTNTLFLVVGVSNRRGESILWGVRFSVTIGQGQNQCRLMQWH